jgi:AcrR family transcriptional regulator
MAQGREQIAAVHTSPVPAHTAAGGRREANKLDKLNRIKAAASDLFVTKGFDDTTVREIASRAGVGLGTLFSYSLNKRDLLFLLGNDRLDQVADDAGAAIDVHASLLQNLLAVFGAHYRYFAQNPVLGRLMLREMTFYESGAQAERFRAIRQRVHDHVVRSLDLAAARGEIGGRRDTGFDAEVLFAIYQVELRRWLAGEDPQTKPGLARLSRALQICVDGLCPRGSRARTKGR